jgi:hypothetical protein
MDTTENFCRDYRRAAPTFLFVGVMCILGGIVKAFMVSGGIGVVVLALVLGGIFLKLGVVPYALSFLVGLVKSQAESPRQDERKEPARVHADMLIERARVGVRARTKASRIRNGL